MQPDYIELDRTFRTLPARMGKGDEFDFDTALGIGKHKVWNDLIAAYRIILLSEAGTGKTEEIRQAAKRQYEGDGVDAPRRHRCAIVEVFAHH